MAGSGSRSAEKKSKAFQVVSPGTRKYTVPVSCRTAKRKLSMSQIEMTGALSGKAVGVRVVPSY